MIVIPARDEGPRIGAVLERLRAVMPSVPVLVVANGCTDDTAAQAAQRDATVVSAPEGYASALAVGYAHALDLWGGTPPEGSWLVQLDADGQHPPEALPAMVAGLSRAHVVIG